MPRLSVDFTEEKLQLLKYYKERKKKSGREILRRALGVYGLVETARSDGEKVVFKNLKTNSEKELVILD